MKNRIFKKILSLSVAGIMVLLPALSASAASPTSLLAGGTTEVQVFNFDGEVSVWKTTYNHVVDSIDMNEGNGCYLLSYDKGVAAHKALYVERGSFVLNAKDVRRTLLSFDMYVSDSELLGSVLASGGKAVTVTLIDANGIEIKWNAPVKANGWNTMEIEMNSSDSSLSDYESFNFNKINGFYVTVGKVMSGLELRFDDLKLVNLPYGKDATGAPYGGRRISCFERTAADGVVISDLPEISSFVTEGATQGKTALTVEFSGEDDGTAIAVGGLSIAADTAEDVLCFDIFTADASALGDAEIRLLQDSNKRRTITSTNGFKAYANDGSGLRNGQNSFRIPLSEFKGTVTGEFKLRYFDILFSTPAGVSWTIDNAYLATAESIASGSAETVGELDAYGGAATASLSYSNPVGVNVITCGAELVTGTTASLYMTVEGSYQLLSAGFRWGTASYSLTNTLPADISQITSERKLSVDITNLLNETTYYFRTYVVTEKGEALGELCSFKTETGLTVTTRSGEGGSVSPDGISPVNAGESFTVAITPDAGYYLSVIAVDGVETAYSQTTQINEYTFDAIETGHTFYAGFAPIPVESEEGGTSSDTDNVNTEKRDRIIKILVITVACLAVIAFIAAMTLPFLSRAQKKKRAQQPETQPEIQPEPTHGQSGEGGIGGGFTVRDDTEENDR